MEPLRITATIGGPICMPERPLALDALLAWAVCRRDSIPPALTGADVVPIEIPVERSACGRFHLASFAVFEIEEHERSYTNRRPAIPELQALSPETKRVQINAGPNKGYRIPREHLHLRDDLLTWWCMGDASAIRVLLAMVTHLGKKVSVGLGRVTAWSVEPCEPWGDGFPIARDSLPLRTLPADTYGGQLAEGTALAYATVTYPYWLRTREELCCVPEMPR